MGPVSIVIPAYRNPGVADCLRSVAAIDPGITIEVIVVLNDATPEMADIVGTNDGPLAILPVPVNLGVSGALNHGFAAAATEFVVALQDDALLEPDTVSALMRCARAQPDAGAVGALVTDAHGRVTDPGHVVWRDGTTAAALIGGSSDPDDYRGAWATDYHGSNCLLVRKAAWESVGGFDPGYYPAYYGDVDFCLRLRDRGWRVLVQPAARARHAGGASASTEYRQFLSSRMKARLMEQHGASLDSHGDFAPGPESVDAERRRAAAAPPSGTPPPASRVELAALAERLRFDPLEVARRERDTLAAFAEHLIGAAHTATLHQRAEVADLAGRLEREHTAHMNCRSAWEGAAAELEATHEALQEALARLDELTQSTSWRLTRWLRRGD